jgi:hypothetical protein
METPEKVREMGSDFGISLFLRNVKVLVGGIFNETDKEGCSALDPASKWRRDNPF